MIATDRTLERRQIENDSRDVAAVVSDADAGSSTEVELKHRTVERAQVFLLGALIILPFSKDDTEVTRPRKGTDKFVVVALRNGMQMIHCRCCPMESVPSIVLQDARSRALPGILNLAVSSKRNMFVNYLSKA
jgi:hypothetical protein